MKAGRAEDGQREPRRSAEPLTIRAARVTDTVVLMRLIRAYYRFDHIRFVSTAVAAALDILLRRPSLGRVWLMLRGEKAVGYVVLTFNFDLEFGGNEGYVTDLYLEARSRGMGLGRRALDVVDEYCRAHGVGAVELQVERNNTAARAFYRRLGFKPHSRIVMTREVRSALKRAAG